MASFKDSAGREWMLTVNVPVAKKAKADTGVELLKLNDNKFAPLNDLLGDPVLFVAVLYSLCEEQIKAAALTPEQFGRSLGGDALQDAAYAFADALAAFFPAKQAAALRRLFYMSREQNQHLIGFALQDLDELEKVSPEERARELYEAMKKDKS